MARREFPETPNDDSMLYALGALAAEQAQALAARINANEPGLAPAVQEAERLVGLFGYRAPAVSPPPTLKARLLDRVHAAAHAASLPAVARSGFDFASLAWERSEDYPGVSFHWLRQDAATGSATAFVKIQPGSRYATHRHRGGEECLVLQGGFRDRRGEYHAGDFVYYEPGSVHYDFQALTGADCILFIMAHGGLELLPDTP